MSKTKPPFLFLPLIWVLLCTFVAPTGPAQAQISLIRDAETESYIRAYAEPLFNAAGLASEATRIYIVNNRELNAFIAGGQNIFVNTGLILFAESADEVIGVLAHETGHISGGHLSRIRDAMAGARAKTIIAMILGAAAMVAGQGDAGIAVIGAGTEVGRRSLLSYSRTQESVADQAAIKLLREAGHSPAGLLNFLERMRGQEALVTANQDPYVRSHPLTRNRIAALRTIAEKSPPTPKPRKFDAMLARMRAKIYAFKESPGRTLRRYREDDRSIPARYARAVALHKDTDYAGSEELIDGLIAEFPNDPYFHELKGQVLFEQGRAADAIAPLRRAVELLPNQSLILTALGQAQVATGDADLNRRAIIHLTTAVRSDKHLAMAWQQLAIAFGRDGQLARSALASAEYSFLIRRLRDAAMFAKRAVAKLPKGTPGHLRAQDLLSSVQRATRKK